MWPAACTSDTILPRIDAAIFPELNTSTLIDPFHDDWQYW